LRLLLTAPILLFLGFNILYGMASGGLLAFTITGLKNLHGLNLDLASAALTGHLFGVVGGILLAGVIADRFGRHLITAAGALGLAAVATMLAAFAPTSPPLLIAIMVVSGLGLGAILPPRDLMIRAVIPPGEPGKVFGFVFVGYSIGVLIASVLFGWLLDLELPAMVLFSAPCSRFWPWRQSSPRGCWRSDPKIKQPKIRFKFRRIIAGPGSRFTYAAATSLSLMVKPPSVAETLIVSPSVMAPSKIRLARGFCNCRWITRFRGRAP
jgi:MFS family permease